MLLIEGRAHARTGSTEPLHQASGRHLHLAPPCTPPCPSQLGPRASQSPPVQILPGPDSWASFLRSNTQHGSLWPLPPTLSSSSGASPTHLLAPHGSPAPSDCLHPGKQGVLSQTEHLCCVLPASEVCTYSPHHPTVTAHSTGVPVAMWARTKNLGRELFGWGFLSGLYPK